MKRVAASFFFGIVFGLGLAVSSMTDPQKVIAFLDFGGAWDPSLLFVMGGAVGVNVFAFRAVLRRPTPLFDGRFHLPWQKEIDTPLVLGSAAFGVGWGLSGFCPGGALAGLLTGASPVLIFVVSMAGGLLLQRTLAARATAPTVVPRPELAQRA